MSIKRILVTAGNTRVPIDRVRGIDNIFKGRTGVAIAKYFATQGCKVTLLTSHPDLAKQCHPNLEVLSFSSFEQLRFKMRALVQDLAFDAIIHSAAVSDYKVAGMYKQTGEAVEIGGHLLRELSQLDSSGKIGSDHPELWMKMVPTVKIVDLIREPWGFKGILVKFKLQVDMTDAELIEIATKSMKHSSADFIVANTLEGLTAKAFIISVKGGNPIRTSRDKLPENLYQELGL
ncbi:MAG: phosphopantothenoylcysteine decarboxylase [Candidatus Paceibacterota bacterium]|jgi:phosphopantothenate-cysteine ligase/phosphopantothenoylcysteine decarboxylase/phosphopantothenate--cysteine ligase